MQTPSSKERAKQVLHKCLAVKCRKEFLGSIKTQYCRECKYVISKRYNSKPEIVRKGRLLMRRLRAMGVYRKHEKLRSTKRKYDLKAIAREKVRQALEHGILVKPKSCSSLVCEGDYKRIEAHHPDYTKPLQVVWLCTVCHSRVHRNRGEKES